MRKFIFMVFVFSSVVISLIPKTVFALDQIALPDTSQSSTSVPPVTCPTSELTITPPVGDVVYAGTSVSGTVAGSETVTITVLFQNSTTTYTQVVPRLADSSWSLLLDSSIIPINLSSPYVKIVAEIGVLKECRLKEETDFLPYTLESIEQFHATTYYTITSNDSYGSLFPACVALKKYLEDTHTTLAPTTAGLIAQLGVDRASGMTELGALIGRPDEYCAFVSNHIIPNKMVQSSDLAGTSTESTVYSSGATTSGNAAQTLITEAGQIHVNSQTNPSSHTVTTDIQETNGIIQVIDTPLLPISSMVDIFPFHLKTDQTSAVVHGTVNNSDLVVLLRIDGTSYLTENTHDGFWTAFLDTEALKQIQVNSILTAIARTISYYNNAGEKTLPIEGDTTSIDTSYNICSTDVQILDDEGLPTGEFENEPCVRRLEGLTMRANYVFIDSVDAPIPTEVTNYPTVKPHVLGAVTTKPSIVRAATRVNSHAGSGIDEAVDTDSGKGFSGVVSANDERDVPFQSVNLLAVLGSLTEATKVTAKSAEQAPWYWWTIGGATIGILYYLFAFKRNDTEA
jgi:Fasciclin domain